MRLPGCITVLGLSRSGVAAALLLQKQGYSVFLSEAGSLTPAHLTYVEQLNQAQVPFETGGHSERAFQNAELVVLSPGIPPTAPIIQKIKALGLPLMSEVELARHFCSSNFKWVGITGTNGKTTTTCLTSWLLQQAGNWHAPYGGNVGVAACQRVLERLAAATSYAEESRKPQALVVELSSYQLAYSANLGLDVAILTHIHPDHLEWHGSYEAYAAAKLSMFNATTSTSSATSAPRWAVLNRNDVTTPDLLERLTSAIVLFGEAPPPASEMALQNVSLSFWLAPIVEQRTGQAIYVQAHPAFEASAKVLGLPVGEAMLLLKCDALNLKGTHNMENMMAAMAVGLIYELPLERLKEAAASFQGVEHRLEWVASLSSSGSDSGTDVYNDSKATNPDACIQALQAFPDRPLILLAGGKDKGTVLTAWAEACQHYAQSIILFGSAAERLEAALLEAAKASKTPALKLSKVETLQQAWQASLQQVKTLGDKPVILLSPACASFDQFLDFEDRGQRFKAMVQQHLSEQAWLQTPLPLTGTPPNPLSLQPVTTVAATVSESSTEPASAPLEATLQGRS